MTRSDLIDALAKEKNIALHIAEQIVVKIFSDMTETLIAGNRIEIRGFGSFVIREYEGYIGRNPKTKEEAVVKLKKAPFFKTGKDLKELIMSLSTAD